MTDPVARSDAFDEHLLTSDLGSTLAGLTLYGKRNRRLIWSTIAAFVVFAGAISYVAWNQHQTSRHVEHVAVTANVAALNAQRAAWKAQEAVALATKNTDLIHSACESLNASRRDTKELWEKAIQLSASRPDPELTPAQKQRQMETTRLFVQILAKITTQRDCSKPNPFVDG